jgi:hypothetical protein
VHKGEYSKGDFVVVAGGTIDVSGVIDTSVNLCVVNEVGENDLLVSIKGSKSPPMIVSQKVCIPVSISSKMLVDSSPLQPCVGDMVFFQGKLSWRDDEPTAVVGSIYEVRYVDGRPAYAKVFFSDQMLELPYTSLMVLQKKSESK